MKGQNTKLYGSLQDRKNGCVIIEGQAFVIFVIFDSEVQTRNISERYKIM